ncbi:MAG: winged helix-turn-helix domain-containing protein [Bacteroidetes bacterium]|nr:winged helix-turn-helix domain-containing protein [Bacteroidota bacterium]
MKNNNNKTYDLISFQSSMFDHQKGSITKNNGEEIFMEKRLKEFFSILLSHENNVVTRSELMTFVWKDVIVSEESISKAVSDLRRFLINNKIENIKIVTISKLGYKLEIEAAIDIEQRKINYSKKVLKIIGYIVGIIVLLIILIRAMRYEQ